MDNKQWMASAPGIAYMGPYTSDVEAWRAVRGADGLPVAGARVWPIADGDILVIKRGGRRGDDR